MEPEKLLFSVSCYLLLAIVVAADDCVYESYDFTPLKSSQWEAHGSTSDAKTFYYISICGPLSSPGGKCAEQAAVCQVDRPGTDTTTLLGKDATPLNITEDASGKELLLYLQGEECPDLPKTKWTTIINFKCGKTLGSPLFLESYACSTYFEWYTSVACKAPPPATHEVKCYTYDENDLKFDLSPLIKQAGAYSVASEDGDFYTNVCRDVAKDGAVLQCPTGSAACFRPDGTTLVDGGKPTTDLKLTEDGDLTLIYTSDTTPAGCDQKAMTTVTFRCPKHDGRATGKQHGDPPKLTSSLGCHYEVLWLTEYACPEDYTVSASCKLQLDVHGVDVDLMPLSTEKHEIAVQSKFGDETYIYHLQVCHKLTNFLCEAEDGNNNHPNVTACQTKKDDSMYAYSLGKLQTQKLRYADGELSLTYSGGHACHSNFKRTTVVNFHCNESAGVGHPVFISEETCTYIFDWDTSHACVAPPPDSLCIAEDGKKKFDLSSLIRDAEENWQALDAIDDGSYEAMYINICHDVVKEGQSSTCPDGAAICAQKSGGDSVDLGHYTHGPTYDASTSRVVLTYADGETCATNQSKSYSSIISLRCKPGDRESAPILTHLSPDLCTYEFEWFRAEACPLAEKTGTACKVWDEEAGFSFDLSPLTKQESDGKAYYTVSTMHHDYYINVCDEVKGTKCEEKQDIPAGVCQVDRTDDSLSKVFNTGQPNSNLTYYDGMMKLTYLDGEAYHTSNPINRKTEIAFLCDLEAGKGSPKFQDETDHTYSFLWNTAYACPETPVECVLIDEHNNLQYDLSSLSRVGVEDNWNTDDGSGRNFYINVCRPLTPVTVDTGCDRYAAACVTEFKDSKERVKIRSLGKAKKGPAMVGKEIILEYTDGAQCDGDKRYSTKIHLQCKKGELAGKCEFSFLWETEAACPIEDTRGEGDCTVTDPNSLYTYDLQQLSRDYRVTDTNTNDEYKLNICGAVATCPKFEHKLDAAVCRNNTPLAVVSKTLHLADGQLSLTYNGKRLEEGFAKTVITFICNRSIPFGEPVFRRKDGADILFDFPTPLACTPDPVDCQVTDDKGNEYDLTPLAKEHGNWRVVDAERSHLKYYINVCRPLNLATGSEKCPGGPIGGCQVSDDGIAHNLGYIQSKPHALSDGTVSLHYYGGDLCHKGTPHQAHRSTRINFYCSNVEHDPVYVSESPECEYVFSWMTPSACPLKKVKGDDCMVQDPLYDETFDLGQLTLAKTSYNITAGEYSFLLNVCGPLHGAPAHCQGDGIGACQTKPDSFAKDAGKFNKHLIYEDGSLQLRYTGGDACHGNKYNRTTIINFVCDHNPGPNYLPQYLKEDFDCTYMFEWRTHLACMPFKPGQCSIEDDEGNSYDLTQLTRTDRNYEVQRLAHLKFVLNVCTVVVHGKGVTCPPNAASCLIDTTNATRPKFVSLGEPGMNQLAVLQEDGKTRLRLTYDQGERCDDSSPGRSKRTIIYLTCNKDAIDTEPEFLYEDSNCDYTFNWDTRAACPLNAQQPDEPEQPEEFGDCTVENPVTGYTYSLESLKKSDGYVVADLTGHSFQINVCQVLQDAGECGEKSGSCQSETNGNKMWNAGNANARLQFVSEGILFLNYTNGKLCNHNQLPRNTIINFVCGAKGVGTGAPVFTDETNDCTYYISWHTELACERQVPCVVDFEGQTLDLAPLMKSDGYHAGTSLVDDAAYYINVCRPLNPIQGVLCPPEASVCRKSAAEEPTSLGRVSNVPFVDPQTGKVAIVYDHGTPCDNGKLRHSKIIFTCQNSEEPPRLLSVMDDNCEYEFEWKTSVVCPSAPVIEHNCTFTDSNTGHIFDFTPLAKLGAHTIRSSQSRNTYYLRLCEPVNGDAATLTACEGATVCKLTNGETSHASSMGGAGPMEFMMEGEQVKMRYTNGKSCGEEKASAVVLLECDRTVVKLGEPTFFAESDCTVVFQWKTPLACPPAEEPCVFTHSGSTYDLSLLSKEKGSWQTNDQDGNKYWLNVCRGVQGAPSGCQQAAAVCRQDRQDKVDGLGKVETQQTYLPDADTLVLQYSQGTNACGGQTAAKVKINFYCSEVDYIGAPKFVSGPTSKEDDCTFDFEWKTGLACKEQRVPVKEERGLIYDPRTDVAINLNLLMTLNRVIEDPSKADYEYIIQLDGHSGIAGCEGASVCYTHHTGTGYQSIIVGAYTSRKWYMEADALEMDLSSESVCEIDRSSSMRSVIHFTCAKKEEKPVLADKSEDCHFVFTWGTPFLCQNLSMSGAELDSEQPAGSGRGHGKLHAVGVVLFVVAVLGLAVLLAVVFRKRERRMAFTGRIRMCFRGVRLKTSYQYSHLVHEDNSLLGANTSGYGTDGEDTGNPFHGDSDDDIVL